MQINRKFLYWGTFFVALGGVLVATNLGALDTATLTDALRLWPLAVVAIGLALVLRRNPQLSLSTGLLAAAVPGLVLGGAFAVAPRFTGNCGALAEPTTAVIDQGTFEGPATVSLTTACGSLAVSTSTGNRWQLAAGNSAGRVPTISSSPRDLSVTASGVEGLELLGAGRDQWDLTLPTSDLDALLLGLNASKGRIDLAGAHIARLAVTGDISEVVLDASAASIANLSGRMNFGVLSIHLPAQTDLVADIRLAGGMVQACTPPDIGLRVTSTGSPRQMTVSGQEQRGSVWESPGYASAHHHSVLDVHATFGAIQINPIGGCK